MYGENFEEEMGSAKTSEASKKRKAINENATKEYATYDWPNLADNGQVGLPFCLFLVHMLQFSRVDYLYPLRMVFLKSCFYLLQLKDLTVTELKYYLNVHNLPVTGKKEALISRILTHMGK